MLHKMDFAIWKRRRDGILHHNIGVTSDDLSDAPWYDYWEQDLDPQAAIEAAKGEVQAAMYNSLGRLSASVIEGSGGLAGTVKAFTDAGKGIADIFGLSSKERDIIAGVDFLGDADIQGGYDFYGNPIDNSATAYLEDYWGGSD